MKVTIHREPLVLGIDIATTKILAPVVLMNTPIRPIWHPSELLPDLATTAGVIGAAIAARDALLGT
jgi:hypothetical protein